MKIGDTFVQDGMTYKVIAENEAGLISKVVDEKVVVEEDATPKRRRKAEV